MPASERFTEILKDPANYFDDPQMLADDVSLTPEQKIELLESWAVDERRLLVAVDENMSGGERSRLDEVLQALNRLKDIQAVLEADSTGRH
ncbi:MAG TPA: hypothetical protein VGL10_04555 [Gammaproteobacteria bacterium]